MSKSGRLIIRAEYVPKLDIEVYDEKLRVVGRVQDVLGPVKAPFVAIKPDKNYRNPSKLRNKTLYVIVRRRR